MSQLHPTLEKKKWSRTPHQRKLGKDGASFTPTEKRRRDSLLKQFSKQRKGYAVSISDEYKSNYDEINWGSNE